jgi:predicted PurR-regulated permease PerM
MRLTSKEVSALRVVLLSVLSIAVAFAALWMLWSLRSIVFLAMAAGFSAFLFLPVAHWLHKKAHLPMSLACAVVVGGIVAVFAGLLAVAIPPLVRETRLLLTSLPDYVKTVQEYVGRFSTWLDRYQLGGAKETIDAVLQAAQETLIQFGQNLVTTSSKKLLSVGALFPFFVLMYFFMRGSHEYYVAALSLPFVRSQRDRANEALTQIAASTRKYVEALAIISLTTAILLGSASALFRINYALTIGVVDFFGEFIPYAGPAAVALLGAFFAAVTGPGKLLIWMIVFTIVESLTSQILAPRLISQKTGLNPGFVILLLLAGGSIAGFFGLLLAVPVAMLVREVIASVRLLQAGETDSTNRAVD